jgi:hypothetical protein
MEFAIIIIVVLVAGGWLGARAWRFFRSASRPLEQGAPACTGCSGCGTADKNPSCPVSLQASALESTEKEAVQ